MDILNKEMVISDNAGSEGSSTISFQKINIKNQEGEAELDQTLKELQAEMEQTIEKISAQIDSDLHFDDKTNLEDHTTDSAVKKNKTDLRTSNLNQDKENETTSNEFNELSVEQETLENQKTSNTTEKTSEDSFIQTSEDEIFQEETS